MDELRSTKHARNGSDYNLRMFPISGNNHDTKNWSA